MKKILTVSLVAIMAVGAAHAQIASTEWVEESQAVQDAAVSALTTRVGTAEQGISDLGTNKLDKITYTSEMGNLDVANKGTVAQQIASKVAQSAYDEKMQTIDSKLDQVATSDNFELLKTDVENLQTSLAEGGTTDKRFDAIEAEQITQNTNITNLQNKDTAIEDKIGTVTEGKTVVEMIADAQAAATYDDTAVKNLISAEESARTQADTTMSGQIDDLGTRLTTAETDIDNLEASLADGGATDRRFDLIEAEQITQNTNITNLQTADTEMAGDISGLDGRLTTAEGTISSQGTRLTTAEGDIADLTAEKVAIAQGQNHAVMTTDAAGNVIPVVPTECTDVESFCVLTSNGVGTYKWENIARATKTSGGSDSGEQD